MFLLTSCGWLGEWGHGVELTDFIGAGSILGGSMLGVKF